MKKSFRFAEYGCVHILRGFYLRGYVETYSVNTHVTTDSMLFNTFGIQGDQIGVQNYAILITNGDSEAAAAETEAQLLRDTGAIIITIGVGTGIDPNLLSNIAGSTGQSFDVDDFQELENKANLAVEFICPGLCK